MEFYKTLERNFVKHTKMNSDLENRDLQQHFHKLQELSQYYQTLVQNNLNTNEKEQENIQKEIKAINDLMAQLELLSERPEWSNSFIPINSIAFIEATIFHTSEHYVKLGNECYTFMCQKEVLKYLQEKIKQKEEVLDSYKEQQKQLEERLSVIHSDELNAETEGMPPEIVSTVGTAYKTPTGFYEIIEPFDENNEKEFYEKRKCNQCRKKLKATEDFNKHTSSQRFDVENRIKAILENSKLYEQLLNDETISNYYKDLEVESQPSEAFINNLIVNALLVEPAVYKTGD